MDFSPDVKMVRGDTQWSRYFVGTRYLDAICEAGGLPVPIPCTGDGKIPEKYIDAIDGFLFIGGADYPPEFYGEAKSSESVKLMEKRRYENDMLLASAVMERHLPILGICAGMQLMNIVSGGKLIQHIDSPVIHTGWVFHKVKINGGKILKELFGKKTIEVNSFHHQAVEPSCVRKDFEVTAMSEDGIIEAIESKSERFILGLQWHPERMGRAHRDKVFKTFMKACKEV